MGMVVKPQEKKTLSIEIKVSVIPAPLIIQKTYDKVYLEEVEVLSWAALLRVVPAEAVDLVVLLGQDPSYRGGPHLGLGGVACLGHRVPGEPDHVDLRGLEKKNYSEITLKHHLSSIIKCKNTTQTMWHETGFQLHFYFGKIYVLSSDKEQELVDSNDLTLKQTSS